MRSAVSSLARFISLDPAADGPGETKRLWRGLVAAGKELGLRAGPLTRQQIWTAWPAEVARAHQATLWRWLDRAVERGLAVRAGTGTKAEQFQYGAGP
jgi:hypothetical protein